MTVPTFNESAAPPSRDCNVELNVAAVTTTLAAKTSNKAPKVAEIFRNMTESPFKIRLLNSYGLAGCIWFTVEVSAA